MTYLTGERGVAHMAKVIAIATQKGGVGKTTSSLEISAALAIEHDMRVLLIDFDSQRNLSLNLDQKNAKVTIYDVLHDPSRFNDAVVKTDYFDFIPGSEGLSKADIEFNKSDDVFLLDDVFEPIKDNYDFIVLDGGPQRNKLFEMIYVAADYVIAPCDNTEFGSEGLINVYQDIEKLKNARVPLSSAQVIGAIVTKYEENTKVDKAAVKILENVMKKINKKAFVMTAAKCVLASESKYERKSLQEYAPYSTTAIDYKNITKAILKYIEKEDK